MIAWWSPPGDYISFCSRPSSLALIAAFLSPAGAMLHENAHHFGKYAYCLSNNGLVNRHGGGRAWLHFRICLAVDIMARMPSIAATMAGIGGRTPVAAGRYSKYRGALMAIIIGRLDDEGAMTIGAMISYGKMIMPPISHYQFAMRCVALMPSSCRAAHIRNGRSLLMLAY